MSGNYPVWVLRLPVSWRKNAATPMTGSSRVSFDRLFFEMDSCISCGICSAVCPVERVMGASRAPILEPLFPAFGSRWDLYTCQELLAHCTQCGICQYNCPKNISIPEIITWAREDISENKEELAPVKAMVRSLREEGNPFGTVIDKGVLIGKGVQPGEADYIFYPGCATLHQNRGPRCLGKGGGSPGHFLRNRRGET